MKRLNCAIYTRKSSDEGLEKEFNSLDAQREACAAFILSQKHAGWACLPDLYDDGGLSGGTMDRPALQRLLGDIQAGKVQIVVVYKVDRLTRSLADFAKIVDVFDAHGASFVSVTQQFNTTTSMGRLTLNMLLSFAQFEREIAGERIRDKIAASKAKGMWMGGNIPLGYDVKDRKLIVNEVEAETVRMIFRRYAELGSVRALGHELEGTVDVHDEKVIVSLKRKAMASVLLGDTFSLPTIKGTETFELHIGARLRCAGKGIRLVVGGGVAEAPDGQMAALMRNAHATREALMTGRDITIDAMAHRLGIKRDYLSMHMRLTYLAPDIVRALMLGRYPPELTPARLLSLSKDLPHDWQLQRAVLGFETQSRAGDA